MASRAATMSGESATVANNDPGQIRKLFAACMGGLPSDMRHGRGAVAETKRMDVATLFEEAMEGILDLFNDNQRGVVSNEGWRVAVVSALFMGSPMLTSKAVTCYTKPYFAAPGGKRGREGITNVVDGTQRLFAYFSFIMGLTHCIVAEADGTQTLRVFGDPERLLEAVRAKFELQRKTMEADNSTVLDRFFGKCETARSVYFMREQHVPMTPEQRDTFLRRGVTAMTYGCALTPNEVCMENVVSTLLCNQPSIWDVMAFMSDNASVCIKKVFGYGSHPGPLDGLEQAMFDSLETCNPQMAYGIVMSTFVGMHDACEMLCPYGKLTFLISTYLGREPKSSLVRRIVRLVDAFAGYNVGDVVNIAVDDLDMKLSPDHYVVLLVVMDALLTAGRTEPELLDDLRLCMRFYTQTTKTGLKALIRDVRRTPPDTQGTVLAKWTSAKTHRNPREAIRFFTAILL